MPEVEALIFDLDGVLVDTINLHFQAWRILAQQHNIPFDTSYIEHFRGIHRKAYVRQLFAPRTLTETEIAHYADIKQHHFLEALRQAAPEQLVLPGAKAFLCAAREMGYRIGVASSSVNAVFTLQYAGLHDLIEVIGDGNTVVRSKPQPDIFIWTAGALRVRPQNVIVFEDAFAGIQAARTAGMFVVGVGQNPAIHHADLILPDLLPERLPDLLESVNLGLIAPHTA